MIYLDHNATTPISDAAKEAMKPFLDENWGNPSSQHHFATVSKRALDLAHEQVAASIGCGPKNLLFTSGGTESNNTAIHAAIFGQNPKRHIITSQIEHPSVLSYCRFLEGIHRCRVTYLPVDQNGLVSFEDIQTAICEETALVSVMWANNETGVISPVNEIGELCRRKGIPFHCDAVQAMGKIPVDLNAVPIDYLSLSAHKFGGPKGVGALFVADDAPFLPLIQGGSQESNRRGGTENISAIIGMGAAAEDACNSLELYDRSVRKLRDDLERRVFQVVPDCHINGKASLRVPNTTSIRISRIDGTGMVAYLDQFNICASTGAACSSGSIAPSHVIMAMTQSQDAAAGTVRFSLSPSNSAQEIEFAIKKVQDFVELCR